MNYYQEVKQIKTVKIPLSFKLKDWSILGKWLLPYSAPEKNDDKVQSCWKSALAQIIIKISAKQEKSTNKVYIIKLSPAEKYALEELLFNVKQDDVYLMLLTQEAIRQLDYFDCNQKRIPNKKGAVYSDK